MISDYAYASRDIVRKRGKRGQMTIFVIVAIAIIAIIAGYFAIRGKFQVSNVPVELEPVFEYYQSCIEQEAKTAINLAGSQGGYVNVEDLDYAPGSEYAPFSSQLNFLGFPIPYWFYVSGNGIVKEQVPSKSDIENEIADYVKNNLRNCNFDSFYAQGFSIQFEEPEVRTTMEDSRVGIEVASDLNVAKGDVTARKSNYNIEVNSKLGKFYDLAKKFYEKQRKDNVLESYGVDVLRLYAPVDGVEVSCSGKTWKTREVVEDLKSGLEVNIPALKFKGDYYNLNDKKGKYYEIDLGENVDENVNLIYSRNMPSKIEINGEGVDSELMIAEPVGIQEGLGVLGFCYAPYHYVYDMSFPVLIQLYNNEEIFQFPVVVVIDKNTARQAELSELSVESRDEFDLCGFKTQDIAVNLYDINLNKADANISYQCFDQRCRLGESNDGRFAGKAPSCLNGYLIVRGEGFAEKREAFSTNKETSADVVLDREYNVNINLEVGGKPLQGTAIVSFTSDSGKGASASLPDVKNLRLSEGHYNVKVYVYGDSSIKIPASKKTQCQEVPRSGLFGLFGATREECFDIVIPETKIDSALRGGGKGDIYLLENQIADGELTIKVDEFKSPASLEELQYNYAFFESSGVDAV